MALKSTRMKSLRVLAAEANYQTIISEFSFIFKKETKSDDVVEATSEADYCLSKKKRDKALKDLRENLDEFLIGPFSRQRQLIVDRFISSCSNPISSSSRPFNPDLFLAFFNCLLDVSFTTFNLTAEEEDCPFQSIIDPLELLGIVSQRCPKLQSLSLCFGTCEKVVPFIPTLIDLLKSFEHLTSLKLSFTWSSYSKDYYPEGTDFLSFFTALGVACPKLINLDLDGDIPVESRQLLALVLGSKYDQLTRRLHDQLTADDVFTYLQFSAQSLSPICSTLERLQTSRCCGIRLSKQAAAFTLRHFANLKECPSILSTAEAVNLLYKHQMWPVGIPVTWSSEHDFVQWTVNASFHGPLNLVSVRNVNFKSREVIEAIGALCPHLKEAHFDGHFVSFSELAQFITTNQLRSLFQSSACWANVVSIGMSSVSPDYRRMLLNCLGRDTKLRKLDLYSCEDIDPITELLPHNKMEILRFWKCTFTPTLMNEVEFIERVPAEVLADCSNRFLPKLKKLEIFGRCMGQWSRLFECHRPLLTELKLTCFHFGLPSTNRFNWNDAPTLWPNVQQLGLYGGNRTAVKALESIAVRLNDFKHLEKLIVSRDKLTGYGLPELSPLEILIRTGHPLPVGLHFQTKVTLNRYDCDYQMMV